MKNRKGVSVVLSALCLLLLVGCRDSDLARRVKELEERMDQMEQLMTGASNSIETLEKLIAAEDNGSAVTDWRKLEDGSGYVLIMSDGEEIVIKSEGTAPKIGTTRIDGILYWTIDGEVMHDADGNPIKAEGKDGVDGKDGTDGQDGKDGEDGVTPQLRIVDGYWEVSLDNGKTWQQVKDENGNPIIAEGSTIDLEITEDEESITIVYNGETFVIPKTGSTPVPDPDPIISVTKLIISQDEATMAVGGTFELSCGVVPENATDKSIAWTSSDEDIATVDENGRVIAIAKGEVTITATSVSDSDVTATCTIEVYESSIPDVPGHEM